MSQLFLHIEDQGVKTSVPFLHHVTDDDSEDFPFRESFTALGEFGEVSCDQYALTIGLFQQVCIHTYKAIELGFESDPEHISLLYAQSGYFRLQVNDSVWELVARTQVKCLHTESRKKYFIAVNPTDQNKFVLLLIRLPIAEATSPLLKDIRQGIEQVTLINKISHPFTTTIDFQKAVFITFKELRQTVPEIPLIRAQLNLLFLEAIRNSEYQRMNGYAMEHWDPDKQVVYNIAESIILGLDESLTIKKFATARHLNPNRLKFLFKKYIGMPAAAFRISIRMQKASQLLKETRLSIQEISLIVGYSNPAQFCTMFKRKMGCTPNQLRKE